MSYIGDRKKCLEKYIPFLDLIALRLQNSDNRKRESDIYKIKSIRKMLNSDKA